MWKWFGLLLVLSSLSLSGCQPERKKPEVACDRLTHTVWDCLAEEGSR